MAKKGSKKRNRRRRKVNRSWASRLTILFSFILFFAVLSLVVSTTFRWTLPSREGPIFGRRVIRVEVLNGCGEVGVAEDVTDWLREQGFDIVYFGNADSFQYEESLLLDRSGRPEFVREVASVLGCENVERRFDGLLLLDVTVIVGKDWRDLNLETADRGKWESIALRLRETMEEWFHL